MACPLFRRLYPGPLGLPLDGHRDIAGLGGSRRLVMEFALADALVALLLADIERKRSLLKRQGIEVQITRCKM